MTAPDKAFEEWHLAQCKPYESDDHCPHKEWERVAWRAAWLASRKAALEEAAAKCKSRISSGPTSDPMVAGANIALRISHDAILALGDEP